MDDGYGNAFILEFGSEIGRQRVHAGAYFDFRLFRVNEMLNENTNIAPLSVIVFRHCRQQYIDVKRPFFTYDYSLIVL